MSPLQAPAPVGVAFSPAGLLFPYYIGVAYSLQAAGLITPSTPIGGSSAGSIAATALACGIPKAGARAALIELCDEYRSGISLNQALRRQLAELLPNDCAEIAGRRLTLCYQQVLPWPRSCIVSEWSDKQDLIDTVAASCNWPFFYSAWPLVKVRGGLGLDGFFALPRGRFGCPDLPAARTLAVCALPRISLDFSAADTIQPGGPQYGLPAGTSDAEWFAWATSAAPEEQLDMMIELGERHADAWLQAEGLTLVIPT